MNNIISLYKKSIHETFLIFLGLIFFNVLDCAQLSLDQIRVLSQEKSPMLPSRRSRSINLGEKTIDLFTQSQAHMSVPEIKKLITATYDIKPYEKIIASVLGREKEYSSDYVFYHGIDNVWRVAQDVYTRLYGHFNKVSQDTLKNFIFLRFQKMENKQSIENFLVETFKTNGLINDHALGSFIIAANVALFGNVGTPPECTWQYFIKSRGHTNPSREIYQQIMDQFNLTYKYIDELMSLVGLYQTKEETILQIFVPKDKVDAIGYLSWIRGIPVHQKTMDLVLRSVKEKKFPKTAPALDHYTQMFKQQQESHPVFKDLIQRTQSGEYRLSYFLNFYRNRPQDVKDINSFQARLMITPAVLLNPLSGVKMFRYSTATAEQLKKYEQKLDGIIKKIIAEKQNKR